MATVGSTTRSFSDNIDGSGVNSAYYEHGGRPSAETNADSSGFVMQLVSFIYNLFSGEYDNSITTNVDKAVGFFQVTWKFLFVLLIGLFTVIKVVRWRNAIKEEYRERKRRLDE